MKPLTEIKGLRFVPVPDFTGRSATRQDFFGRHDRPIVPREIEDVVKRLFFEGGLLPILQPDIDRSAAYKAMASWLHSWVPAHEAKISTAAYALWVWVTPAEERG